jgi:hypothetical protein
VAEQNPKNSPKKVNIAAEPMNTSKDHQFYKWRFYTSYQWHSIQNFAFFQLKVKELQGSKITQILAKTCFIYA